MSGPDWQSVRRGLRALTTPRLLKHCDDVQCVLPDVVLDPRETASELHHDPAHVQRLEDLGLTQGWVAKGSGTHIFQTTWTRPAYWVVTHEPVYRMILHTTMNARWIDPSRSNVRISLNGIPLDQFSLESTHDAGTTRHELIARIPQSFWLEQSWTFVIEASIYTQSTEEGDEKRCSASNEHIWIRLDPATGLWVPRKEHRATGLSSFGLETPPVVVWESSRSVKQMMTLGALMYPLTLNHGELDVARDGAMCAKSSSCVFMSQDPGELPDPFSLVSHDHHTGLVDQSGIYAIPVLDVESTLVLTMQSQGLFLWFPDTLSQPVPPPDYAQLRGTQALFVKDTWIGAPASKDTGDMVNIRMPFSESADAAPRDGETQQLVQLVELLWWAVLAVSGIGAMFYFSRRVKATPMDQFDARGYENLERHKEE